MSQVDRGFFSIAFRDQIRGNAVTLPLVLNFMIFLSASSLGKHEIIQHGRPHLDYHQREKIWTKERSPGLSLATRSITRSITALSTDISVPRPPCLQPRALP